MICIACEELKHICPDCLSNLFKERDLWKMRSDDAEKEIVRLLSLLATERDEFGKKEAELKAEIEESWNKNGASLRAWIAEKAKAESLASELKTSNSRCARLEEALKEIK